MYIKAYSFASHILRLESDTPVYNSNMFESFVCDPSCEADITVKIKHSAMPEKVGTLIFRDSVSEYYENGDTRYYYTSFPSISGSESLACRVTRNEEITLIVAGEYELWDSMVNFALNYTQLFYYKGIATMHCSCVEVNGKALLFAGDKHVGKSTQAALWSCFRGAKIINGDRIALSLSENGITAHGIPVCGSSGIALNESLEVEAIILPGKADVSTITRLDTAEAFKSVIGNLTYNQNDIVQLETALDFAQKIAEKVPVYSLMCTRDESAVKILEVQLWQS